jgi:hypothetical protein
LSRQFQFCYQCPPIGLVPPQAGGATVTSSYKSLGNSSGKVAIVCHINQGNVAEVEIIPLQAQDDNGTGSKAIGTNAPPPIFYNANTTVSDTLVAQAAAANFTTDASLADKIVVFEFDPADALDLANGFNHIAVQIVGSNAANIVEAHMEYLGRFQQQVPPASEQ